MDRKANLICTALAGVFLSTPTLADWSVESVKDRMTDKTETIISVRAPQAAIRFGHPVRAHFQIECWKNSEGFTPLPSIVFGDRVALGEVGLSWRIDDKPVQQRVIRVTGSGDVVHLTLLGGRQLSREIANAKRLRVTVFWKLDQPGFYEFDLSGGKDAYAKLACR